MNHCTTPPETDNLKQCSKCGEWKPATREHFAPREDTMSGIRGECLICYRIRKSRERNIRGKTNPDYGRKWRIENPDYGRKWRLKNPGYDHRRRLYKGDKLRENIRQWRLANPHKVRAYDHNRRARELQAEGSHTAADIRALYKSQKGRCWYCGKKVGDKYHVDHRVPLSRGGSNAPENLVIACPECNLSKHNKLPHEWCGRLL